jgi:putative intracellular protease/amidase
MDFDELPRMKAPVLVSKIDFHLRRVTREISSAGKPIACLCHGIEILVAADCIRGKRVTTVPKCAMDAEQGGDLCERARGCGRAIGDRARLSGQHRLVTRIHPAFEGGNNGRILMIMLIRIPACACVLVSANS